MGDDVLAQSLRRKGITDERVLEAIASLHRKDFVPAPYRAEAGGDYPLPIGFEQTISQPYVVAFMTQALGLSSADRVLEIGTGSGYQTAVLAGVAREVYSVEILPELFLRARKTLADAGVTNIHLREGDGHRGWPEAAPFDAILLTAAPERLPQSLVDQLKQGGRLVGPIGSTHEGQELIRMEKLSDDTLRAESLIPVRFVGLVRPPAGD